MEFSIQRPLYARCVEAIGGLVSSTHNSSKYMGLQTKDGKLVLYINRDEIVGKVALDEKTVGDKGLFSIVKEGSVLVDGQINIQAITKDTSSDSIKAAFIRGKTDNAKEGTLEYNYPNGEKIGLQSVEENTTLNIEIEKINATFLGKELSKYALFSSLYAGSPTGHPQHANLLFSAKDGIVTFAGTDARQFGICNFKPEKSVSEEFSVTIPHNLFTSVCKLLSPDDEVEIQITDNYIIFKQKIIYATAVVGEVYFKVVLSKEPFVKYERTLNHLDFKTVAKASTEMMARAFERLSVIKSKGCKMNVDVSRKMILFGKREASGYADNINVPLIEATGADMEINISNDEFRKTIHQCTTDEFNMKFSSSSGIGLIQLDETRKVYFTPYRG